MAPVEFHRYIDARGDTIIYKFDPEIARNPDPAWPSDSAISVYHHYVLKKHCTLNHHSDLLPLDLAVERWRNDKQSVQPIIGMVMYKEDDHTGDGFGAQLKTQYMWKGWNHGEGYRRGWAKLQICGLDGSECATGSQQDKRQEPTGLEPFPRVKPAIPPAIEERKDSKDLQDFGDLHAKVYSQSPGDVPKEGRDHYDILGLLESPSLPDAEPELDLGEPSNEHDQIIGVREEEQDSTAHKQKRNKHKNRGKRFVVDYTLKVEHWPGLLHTPR